eukprot:CAMPEP_0113481920 /NCGR_PEP_ID=MMETSP0014_2-20120614/22655_1 /TAXON_ID=2857 /ORGANISM="Nitzschia sp." /LENGTH=889 /DNA_ID=CAMNT_0000375427 /DNA_START=567 /DNA_END=3236 /DNA_ORIENTATION=- /assembly_acc=CAM_ASM_000159
MAHPTYSAMRVRRRESPPLPTRRPSSGSVGSSSLTSSSSSSSTKPQQRCSSSSYHHQHPCSINISISRKNNATATPTPTTRKSRTSSSSSSPAAVLTRRVTRHVVLMRGSHKLNTKTNPHVGSFRHAPPTTFKSMEVSDTTTLHYLVETIAAAAAITSSASFPYILKQQQQQQHQTPLISNVATAAAAAAALTSCSSSSTTTTSWKPFPILPPQTSFSSSSSAAAAATAAVAKAAAPCFAMKTSPYVGFMRHAPPSSSVVSSQSQSRSRSPPTTTKNDKQQQQQQHKKMNDYLELFPSSTAMMDSKETDLYHPRFRPCGVVDGELDKKLSRASSAAAAVLGLKLLPLQSPPALSSSLLLNVVDGRLVGGSPDYYHRRRHQNRGRHDANASSVLTDPTKVSSALKLLNKMTSWLLDTVCDDDDDDDDEGTDADNSDDGDEFRGDYYYNYDRKEGSSRTNGLKVLAGRPYDSGYDYDSSNDNDDESVESERRHSYRHGGDVRDGDDNDGDASQDSDTSSSSLPASDVLDDQEGLDPHAHHRPTPPPSSEFSEMNVSVSEIAEAYYAHQLIDEANALRRRQQQQQQQQQQETSRPNEASSGSNNQLDYVITQMDIARMARNASRHLDVDSILTLPTVVYRKSSSSSSPQGARPAKKEDFSNTIIAGTDDSAMYQPTKSHLDPQTGANSSLGITSEAFSFVMVSGVKSSMMDDDKTSNNGRRSNGSSLQRNLSAYCSGTTKADGASHAATNTTTTTPDEVCVICLEAFRNGDRLRVLPCDHSFHIGCIDRWLSGSHSYDECFTAGCPTCKKRLPVPPSSQQSHQPVCGGVVSSETTTAAFNTAGDEHGGDDDDSLVPADQEDHHDDEMESNTMDGSVPSWAFAKLGSSLWQHD